MSDKERIPMDTHHIHYDSLGCEDIELDLIVFCRGCHLKHDKARRWHRDLGKKVNDPTFGTPEFFRKFDEWWFPMDEEREKEHAKIQPDLYGEPNDG